MFSIFKYLYLDKRNLLFYMLYMYINDRKVYI